MLLGVVSAMCTRGISGNFDLEVVVDSESEIVATDGQSYGFLGIENVFKSWIVDLGDSSQGDCSVQSAYHGMPSLVIMAEADMESAVIRTHDPQVLT